MRKLTPGWQIGKKLICVECAKKRPDAPWQLMHSNECSNAKNHHKKSKKRVA